MAEQTFLSWLQSEANAAKCALLRLIEEEDRLRFMEGPALERRYMEAVGSFEEEVVRTEMECELLAEKQKLMQIAINRKEKPDLSEIDAMIDQLRAELTKEAEGEAMSGRNELSLEQAEAMQAVYSNIIRKYHPATHPELSQTQKELYQKAQDAYRIKDMQALELIEEMLESANDEGFALTFNLTFRIDLTNTVSDKPKFAQDNTLAAQIYPMFEPTMEEAAAHSQWQNYLAQGNERMERIRSLREEFPFNAQEMLADSAQIDAYKAQLEERMRQAKIRQRRLINGIEMMTERMKGRG